MWKSLQKSEVGGRILLILLLGFFLINGWNRRNQKSDFLDYYHASERWKAGENLYKFDVAYELKDKVKSWEELFLPENAKLLSDLQTQTATYIYPPLFAYLLLPLTYFPAPVASGIHQVIGFLCLLGILYLFWKGEFFGRNFKNREWILSLVLLLNFRFLESHVQNNQVGLLLVLLVLLALIAKNDGFAGILLALATSIKVTPLVFLAIFVYQKRWKAILWFVFGIFVWNALPASTHLAYTQDMTWQWWKEVLGNALTNPLLRSWKNNQSLPSTLAKYFISGADFVNQPLYRMPFLDLEMKTVQKIQAFILLLSGIPILFLMRQKNREWELTSLLFLASAIFSGISWVHSFVVCLFPIYFLLTEQALWGKETKGKKILLGICLIPLLSHRSVVGSTLESVLLMVSILLYYSFALYTYIIWKNIRADETRH
ncbi:hypothetical protein LPTSP4_34890 [Leptospira ryugenii]|uniref:PF09594 family protein n=1 Tax=Leptospira ryugenii TaxID=1917863 RepID=A0A2P2E4Z1_9LEPT|nr:glycosyltransferase family 87 protein [Leptospira ryugenii]GBF51951.1 hypothetical protein LPTSP4_34890 [Leptospira ryugenii]